MNKLMKMPGLFGGLLLLVLMSPHMAMAAKEPGVTMKDMAGAFHDLSEYTGQGKWTVVMLWASDCHVCNHEAAEHVKFHQRHKDTDAVVLGISLDGQEKLEEAKQFVARHDVSFPNLIDEPLNVARFYSRMTGGRWAGTPTFMVYAPNGELRAAQVGAVPTQIIESFIQR